LGEKNAPGDAASGAFTDYQYNLSLGMDNDTTVQRGFAVAALTQVSSTVLANDAVSSYSDSYSAGCSGVGLGAPGYTCAPDHAVYDTGFTGSSQRHLETQNFVFTDGHVKAYRSQNETTSAAVWNYATPGSTSGNSPTYNPAL
jgi:prepilin-type processing-associated H-X9-DG protein